MRLVQTSLTFIRIYIDLKFTQAQAYMPQLFILKKKKLLVYFILLLFK